MSASDTPGEGRGRPENGGRPRDPKLPPRIIDISRPLSASTPVWPGDAPTRLAWTARIADGSSVNVGQLASSLHAATHADAPLHFVPDGAAIDEANLSAYYGSACVLERVGTGAITAQEVSAALHGDQLPAPRVLFKTWPSSPPVEWVDDFAYFDPAAIDLLASLGAVLVGIDTPSFDAVDSGELASHHALYRHGLVNLENLNLSDAEAGETYTLSAFPLRMSGMDASPVRAVLIA